jgi:exopolyphosphatase/guanosine-5'-triphosphate,3'-diphosphate pyrophosphatase
MNKVFVLLCLSLISFMTYANECLETRAAFDIGSGATKIKVAQVDICKQKIFKVLLNTSEPVTYKESLMNSSDNTLPMSIIQKGIKAINSLKTKASTHNPTLYIATATSAFRTAKNGVEAIKILNEKTGVKIKIISQEEEAKIGFVGATVYSNVAIEDTIVWDIGGGSMQISSYLGNDKFSIYKGKLASVSFKNYIMNYIQQKPIQAKTPNPISDSEYIRAEDVARIFAQITVPEKIKRKLNQEKTEVIGIGGVHYSSLLRRMTQENRYNVFMLESYIHKLINKTDSELGGGKYVSTDVTNPILVLGFMDALGIQEVTAVDVNLADGLLVMPEII